MLSVDDLRFFATVARARSLAEAARRLDVTPSAVTQRLQQLEACLGVRLVNRSTRSLSLTQEGEFLTEKGQGIVTEIEGVAEALSSRADVVAGHLRIAAPFGFGRRFVASAAAAFQTAYPETTLSLSLSDDPIQLPSDSWDVAIHIGKLRDSSRVMIKLAPNERVLCAAPAYLDRAGRPDKPEDLRKHQCVALRENDEDVTLWRLGSSGEKPVSVRIRPAISSNDGEVVLAWGLAGLGIILRSEWHVAEDLKAGRLVRVLPAWSPASADIVAMFGARHGRAARTTRFMEVLRKTLVPVPWRKPQLVHDSTP